MLHDYFLKQYIKVYRKIIDNNYKKERKRGSERGRKGKMGDRGGEGREKRGGRGRERRREEGREGGRKGGGRERETLLLAPIAI